jgi:arsenate reductase (glutaredoxin)
MMATSPPFNQKYLTMRTSTTVYGIPNCDTVKKARDWLTAAGIDYDALSDWLEALGWELLVNRKGTTWRKLDPALQAATVDAPSAATLMREHPSVIKRPVVRWSDGSLSVGFSAAQFETLQRAL